MVYRRFIGKLVKMFGIACGILQLITLIIYHTTFGAIPFLSMLSLFVPVLMIINLAFGIYWILRKELIGLLPASAVVLSFLVFGSFYQFRQPVTSTSEESIKIMSFNVRGFNDFGLIKDERVGDKIIDFVKGQNPDIVCFQEFSRIYHRKLRDYSYKTQTPYGLDKTIQAIFSKFPIVGEGSLDFPGTVNNTIYADILYKQDTIRVYNVHLQSYQIYPSMRYLLRSFPRKITGKINLALLKQREQVKILRKHIENSPYRSIVCMDLNNSQFSNFYRIVKKDMKDSFTEAGKGYGYTIKILRYPIRIDFILTDPSFDILHHENFYPRLSDHYPIAASVSLNPDE